MERKEQGSGSHKAGADEVPGAEFEAQEF